MVFCHLYKHRVFRKNKKICDDPTFASQQEEDTVLEWLPGGLVPWCPHIPLTAVG